MKHFVLNNRKYCDVILVLQDKNIEGTKCLLKAIILEEHVEEWK